MNGFQAIIFDKDGTLFDFQATWGRVMLKLLEQVAPGGLRDTAAQALGVDARSGAFARESVVIAGTTQDVAAVLASVTGKSAEEVALALDAIGTAAAQVPAVDLARCLGELRCGYRLGVVTNDSEAPARAHLEAAGIAGLFEFVAGYDSGFGAKPAPGQLLAFAEATGVAPDATVMVGDSLHDLEAGRRAGMATVGVLTGIATEADLSGHADVVLPDIGHLAAWLASSGAR